MGPFGTTGERLLLEFEIWADAARDLLPAFMLSPLLKPAVLDVKELPGVWAGIWPLNAPTI